MGVWSMLYCCLIQFIIIFFLLTDIETNECLNNNGGCWQDKTANITACKVVMELFILKGAFLFLFMLISVYFSQDTFRGRVCECPIVQGVQFKGDGYTTCEGKPLSLSLSMVGHLLLPLNTGPLGPMISQPKPRSRANLSDSHGYFSLLIVHVMI